MKEITPELERKNLVLGWALFGIFVLLFAGTVGIASPVRRPRLSRPPELVFLKHKLFVNRMVPCNRQAKGGLCF